MKAVTIAIRLLVVIQVISNVRCQDGYSERDLLHLQQPPNDGQVETITSYSTNIIQRDPNSQSISSVSVQYHMSDPEKNEEYSRAGRSRKVYRIKNPFDHQNQQDERQETTAETDSGTGASNQYAAMQYSLPPEEFLQQMRAENQYYQQASTPSPHLGYTATPQPQYQYSTISPNYDDNNHQSNQVPQLEPKTSIGQNYLTPNQHQYGNVYKFDGSQSTPASVTPHFSTVLPNSQYVGTQSSSYLSSASPIYISSPPNLQHYVSSPLSNIQDVSPDYSNRVSSTIGSNAINYENEYQKKMLIDHYDNSAHGVRYPVQQFLNDYPSSTISPSSSPYSDQSHDSWQNQQNRANSVSKSLQEMSLTQFQNYPYNNNNNQQDMRSETHMDSTNSDTHRLGNVPAANTLYLNYAQPEFQSENTRTRTRSYEDNGQNNYYSHGDYGWKLQNKKSIVSTENYPQGSFGRYQYSNQPMALQSTPGAAVSQMNFHMDTGRPQQYEQVSKSGSDSIDSQDFARAAAKAQERQQQQQQQQQIYGNNYSPNYNLQSSNPSYGNNDKQRNRYNENINSNNYQYNNLQTDVVTAPPYYYLNSKENSVDPKSKLPFDHDKALKNIVPIDVSNVVGNSESQIRGLGGQDNNRYNVQNFGKNQLEENLKQYYRSVTDAYYKDKNSIYGFNIKSRPDDIFNGENKQLDSNLPLYAKQQQQIQEAMFNQGNLQDKRYFDGSGSTPTYVSSPSSNYQDSIQSSANVQQQGLQRPQNTMPNDIANILKLNDVPYRFTSGLTEGDTLRLHNNNNFDTVIPTSLPNRINQNVGSHQLDVAILNKLLNKQSSLNLNRPDIDPQASGVISNINGFKVANPFNVDLKLVADMLKGKPAYDDTQLLPLGSQFSKTIPLKLDLSQLQQLLLKNENTGSYLNDGLNSFSNPYLDFYGPGRPYQGVKYSRSQEEEESETIIPIADASNNHPIGAVMEQLDDITNEREPSTGSDDTAQDDESMPNNYKKRPKHFLQRHRIGDKHRHPNSLPEQRPYTRRYPKLHSSEPYPLLKPPPPKNREARNHFEKNSKRRRVKPKVVRVLKSEPLYEAGADIEEEEATVPTLLRPPPPIADAKMDSIDGEENSDEK